MRKEYLIYTIKKLAGKEEVVEDIGKDFFGKLKDLAKKGDVVGDVSNYENHVKGLGKEEANAYINGLQEHIGKLEDPNNAAKKIAIESGNNGFKIKSFDKEGNVVHSTGHYAGVPTNDLDRLKSFGKKHGVKTVIGLGGLGTLAAGHSLLSGGD